MKLLISFWKSTKKTRRSRLFGADYKQTILLKQGKDQFEALVKKGLGIPVALL